MPLYLLLLGMVSGGLIGGHVIDHALKIGAALQSRLMDLAGDAQTLAATMNHASFNVANALGPWLASLAITSSGSWAAPAWVGAAMALGGLVLLLVSLWLERRASRPPPAPPARLAEPALSSA